jgi:hypothetical protein
MSNIVISDIHMGIVYSIVINSLTVCYFDVQYKYICIHIHIYIYDMYL